MYKLANAARAYNNNQYVKSWKKKTFSSKVKLWGSVCPGILLPRATDQAIPKFGGTTTTHTIK